ncbi:hypothetical protein PoB_002067100 [Plakobranchus ocellatus]|uniref:Uncharacterized protein n=1 Tax=Plakobranchus ocellatus TaxID=259542 RepID=A0AAV3ZHQ9_9GAST|nr:hypothetical protein PoB_002067100 [Plakobranchus ocellatus]
MRGICDPSGETHTSQYLYGEDVTKTIWEAQETKCLTTSLRADNRAYKQKNGEKSFLGERHSNLYRRWKTSQKSFKMKNSKSRYNKGRKQSHQ